MSSARNALAVAIPVLLAAGLALAVVFWPRGPSGDGSQGGEWTCSMHPQVRQPGPGQCPICGMKLVPVGQLADEQSRLASRAGLETEKVDYRELYREVRTVGKFDYNEGRVAYITARIAGRVDRVYVEFTGIPVKPKDHLVDIYSPDLYVAQTQLIQSLDELARAAGDKTIAQTKVEAARFKLLQLGILNDQIAEIEKSRQAKTHLTIYAPMGGTVVEKTVRAGQYVKEGDQLYRIAELDPIWLYLDVYESDLALVRYGQAVDVNVEAYPAEPFRGTVTFIDPFLEDRTRTVKARVNIKNPDLKLKPGMYATAVIRARLRPDGTPEPTGLEGKYICPMHPEVVADGPGKCPVCEMQLERVPQLRPARPPAKDDHAHHGHDHAAHDAPKPQPGQVLAVRASAVLTTGRRNIVYRKRADGAYELVELAVGPRAEGKDDAGQPTGYYPVLKGLAAGDRVVVRGGFLLDSQRQIEGMPSLIFPEGQGGANLHAGHGGPPPAAPSAPSGAGHKH